MLKKISFSNFKCFQQAELSFKALTIIVGQNNAGKSSIVEALRLIALAGRKSINTSIYTFAPREMGLSSNLFGFTLKVDKLKMDTRTLVYYYQDDLPAIITATFENKSKIVIYIKNELAFACIYDSDGNSITTKSKAKDCQFGSIKILPQIGLIKEHEKYIDPVRVNEDKDTYLTSRHFRNELYQNKNECFVNFKQLAEETWSGLQVSEPEYSMYESDTISFMVRDANFVSEIGLMGSGIQMWLQVVWFICRSSDAQTIILDEPDVYMHPDLQKKVLFLLRERFPQIVIATHSVEIITSVEPSCIVAVDKNTRRMRYASDGQGVQKVIDGIGGVHNLSLIRIALRHKCVFLEGDDLQFFIKFARILQIDGERDISTIPCVALGGLTRLDEAFGAANLFYQETQGQIKTLCIVDRDYYPEEYFDEIIKRSENNHLWLHVFRKKEIENYFLVPAAIFRLTKLPNSSFAEFLLEYEKLVDSFSGRVQDCIAGKMHEYYRSRGKDPITISHIAREYFNTRWTTLESKIALVSGKELLSNTNAWMQERYGKHCSLSAISKCMIEEDVDQEIVAIINEFCKM